MSKDKKIIYCDKILIPFMTTLFFLIFDGMYFGLCYKSKNIILLIVLNVVINIIGIYLISYLFIRKKSRRIIIDNSSLEYIAKENSFKISLNRIDNLTYMKSINGFFDLFINFIDGYGKDINLTKRVIKKIAKYSNKKLIHLKNENIKSFKEEIYDKFVELKEEIITHRHKIIASLIGLVVTILSIGIYQYINNNILCIFLCIFSFVFTILQLYLLYFKDKSFGLFGRIFLSFISTIIMGLIFFCVLAILFNKVFNMLDIFIYTIYILPSFVIVILLILLLITGLSYA